MNHQSPNELFLHSSSKNRMMMKTSDAVSNFIGGLIGAYSLTREERLLDRAVYYYTSIIKNSFLVTRTSDTSTTLPKRFLEPIPGFEIPFSTENNKMKNNNNNNNKIPISEILSSLLPVEYLMKSHHSNNNNNIHDEGTGISSFSSSSSSTLTTTQFIDWLVEEVNILRGDKQEQNSKNNKNNLHHYLDEDFLKTILGGGDDDDEQEEELFQMLSTSGILPCFIDSKTKRFSGSISLTNEFGRYQLESYLKHWILFHRYSTITENGGNNNNKNKKSSTTTPSSLFLSLYENAIDGMFKFLARYSSASNNNNNNNKKSSSSSSSYFAGLGEISVSDFLLLLSSSSFTTSTTKFETCRIPGILSLGLSFGVHHHHRESSSLMKKKNLNNNLHYSDDYYAWNETDVEVFASDLLTSCLVDVVKNNDNNNTTSSSTINKQHSSSSIKTIFGIVESLFYLHRYTRDHGLREIAWMLFEEVIVAKRPSIIEDDDEVKEIFFSQTLKFLFLIFSGENVVGYDEFVFDFHGHPFRIVSSLSRGK